jgi:flagellar biosynthesis chaperone FliJ
MSTINEAITASIGKIAYAAAAAAVLGGGVTVLETARQVAVLEQRVEDKAAQLERIEGKIDRLYEVLTNRPRENNP